MLRHAFETLGCIRVEFKTDLLNERSRKALLRIRDSVYFSIIDTEWPAVNASWKRCSPDQIL